LEYNTKPIKISNRNIMFSDTTIWSEYALNMGLILGVRHNFVIDTGLGSGSVAPILEYLKNDAKPIVVINTHADWDHIWGNHVFENGLIIAHRVCLDVLTKHWAAAYERNKDKVDGEVRKCLPNTVFDSELEFAEDGVKIFYTPGHTPCSISVFDVVDRVLYVGDNFGDTMDTVLPEIHTNPQTMMDTVQTYKSLDAEVFVCGHNKPQGVEFLQKMESELVELVKKHRSAKEHWAG